MWIVTVRSVSDRFGTVFELHLVFVLCCSGRSPKVHKILDFVYHICVLIDLRLQDPYAF